MGQQVYIVPGSSGLQVPAANATGPGVAPPLTLVFPRSRFVTGLLVIPRTSTGALTVAAMLAALALSITDENQEQLISDARGTLVTTSTGALAVAGAGASSLNGPSFRPFPLQRGVRQLYPWVFNVLNNDTNITTLAGIFLLTEAPSK